MAIEVINECVCSQQLDSNQDESHRTREIGNAYEEYAKNIENYEAVASACDKYNDKGKNLVLNKCKKHKKYLVK